MEHHYEKPGEEPYIKYGCPVCEALENRHGITKGIANCPSCGVNISWENWDLGGNVMITMSRILNSGFNVGETCKECINCYGYNNCHEETEDECSQFDEVRSDYIDSRNGEFKGEL